MGRWNATRRRFLAETVSIALGARGASACLPGPVPSAAQDDTVTQTPAFHSRHVPEPWLDFETPMGRSAKRNGLCDTLEPDVLLPKRSSRKGETLGGFLEAYIAKRTDVKGGTRVFYGHTRRNLVDFFGSDKPLLEITKGDAEDFRRYLIEQGLSAASTVNRRCCLAKYFSARRSGTS